MDCYELVCHSTILKLYEANNSDRLTWRILKPFLNSGHVISGDANLWRCKIWKFFFYNTLVSNYPTQPPCQEKRDETSSPSNQPPCPQIDLELPIFTLTLQREKRKKISKVFRGLPKLTQS